MCRKNNIFAKRMVTVLLCAAVCLCMLLGVLFFPQIRIGKLSVSSYWVVALIGAAVLLACGQADIVSFGKALIADTAVNPLKILALFLSMTMLSVFLDELGFFRHLASVVLRRSGTSQTKLFFTLYGIVSLLTVFTSNDVIILSFTPFICYFAKNAKIDPLPYLFAELVAANTWSMMLVIGNPTNIYLATAYGVDFLTYLRYAALPTVCAGAAALLLLWLVFRKKLSSPIEGEAEEIDIADPLQLWVGIGHLGACTLLLAVGPYLGLPMWIVSLAAVGSLFLFTLIVSAVRREKPKALCGCLKRAPWQLIPFVLSMFVLVVALSDHGITEGIAELFGASAPVWKYGPSSFLAANFINNIPMSELFAAILSSAEGAGLPAVFATVIGSNLGALLTPVGALAGLMWSSILSRHGVKFGYGKFLRYGALVSVPTLLAALGALQLAFLF